MTVVPTRGLFQLRRDPDAPGGCYLAAPGLHQRVVGRVVASLDSHRAGPVERAQATAYAHTTIGKIAARRGWVYLPHGGRGLPDAFYYRAGAVAPAPPSAVVDAVTEWLDADGADPAPTWEEVYAVAYCLAGLYGRKRFVYRDRTTRLWTVTLAGVSEAELERLVAQR